MSAQDRKSGACHSIPADDALIKSTGENGAAVLRDGNRPDRTTMTAQILRQRRAICCNQQDEPEADEPAGAGTGRRQNMA
jgi:hypothetical protein